MYLVALIMKHTGVQRTPILDLILAVENTKEFHEANLKMNKHHYTYMAQWTKCKVVNFF